MVDYEHDFKLIDVIGHYTGKERLNEILEGIWEYDTFYNYFYSGVSNSIASCSSVGAELFWKNFKMYFEDFLEYRFCLNLDQFIGHLRNLWSQKHVEEIENFFKNKDTKEYASEFAKTV